MTGHPSAFFRCCLTRLRGDAERGEPDRDDAGDGDARVGAITLHRHQRAGARRLLAILERHGGALLADEVGLGKTYTALAVACRHASVLVVAPAAVRDVWRAACRRGDVSATIVSYEQLSAGYCPPAARWALVILDEAHRARSPATRRYRALAHLTLGARVLLLTATPIHNRRTDLEALLALFLGAGAGMLDDAALGALVVRHQVDDAGVRLPALGATVRHDVPPAPAVLEALRALPPPLPPAGGGVAEALVALQLTRAWCSSDAALLAAIRRRLASAAAIEHALSCGRLPARRDLAAWTAADDGSVQLAFPELVAAPAPSPETIPLLDVVRRHASGLRALRALVCGAAARDDARFAKVRHALASCDEQQAVVFTHSAETAEAAYRALRDVARAALLTGRRACIASGPVPRQDLLAAFAPGGRPPRNDIARVDVLVASDVLSEGVDLHGASVVIHLDLPWTIARFEQRIGRLRRLGSAHHALQSHLIAPPVDADELALTLHHLARKARLVADTVGPSSILRGAEAWEHEARVDNDHSPIAARQAMLRALEVLDRAARGDLAATPHAEIAPEAPDALGTAGEIGAGNITASEDLHGSVVRWRVDGLAAPQALALVSIDGEPHLLAADDAGVSIAPGEVVARLEALARLMPPREPRATAQAMLDSCNPPPLSSASPLPVERAIVRWSRHQAAQHQLAPDVAHASPGHRRILRALGEVVARAPRGDRAVMAQRAADGRRLVMAQSGVGVELLLASLASQAPVPQHASSRAAAPVTTDAARHAHASAHASAHSRPHPRAQDDRAWLDRVLTALRDTATPGTTGPLAPPSPSSERSVRLEAVLTLLPGEASA